MTKNTLTPTAVTHDQISQEAGYLKRIFPTLEAWKHVPAGYVAYFHRTSGQMGKAVVTPDKIIDFS